MTFLNLVKKRVYRPWKDIFFYPHCDAQYSLKLPARVTPIPLLLPIYFIMTSFSQKSAKFFSFVDFYFIHSHCSYGWTWISKIGSLNKWDMGNLQMHSWRHMMMTSQCRNKSVTKTVKLPFWVVVNSYNFHCIWCRALILLLKKVHVYWKILYEFGILSWTFSYNKLHWNYDTHFAIFVVFQRFACHPRLSLFQ